MPQPIEAGKKTARVDLQDEFLSQLIESATPMSCFLVNGIRLAGIVVEMDKYTILIANSRGGTAPQMVYKAAISTICPDITNKMEPRR